MVTQKLHFKDMIKQALLESVQNMESPASQDYMEDCSNLKVLNQCTKIIGFLANSEDEDIVMFVFNQWPDMHKDLLEILSIQFLEYKTYIEDLSSNFIASNQNIMKLINFREKFLRETFWALSNLCACSEPILDKFLKIEHEFGQGQTGFDLLVQNCFLAKESS